MEKPNSPLEQYHSKEVLSHACSEIIENLLKKTYDEENPFKHKNKSAHSSDTDTHQYDGKLHKKIKRKSPKCRPLPEENDHEGDRGHSSIAHRPNSSICETAEVRYMVNNTNNPFETLLTKDESFIYQSDAHQNFLSQTNIHPEMGHEENVDGLSVSEQMVHSHNQVRNENPAHVHQTVSNDYTPHQIRSAVTAPAYFGRQSYRIHNSLTVNPSSRARVVTYIRDHLNDFHGQGDNEDIDNCQYHFFEDTPSAISIRVNFSFYAKLLALLLTLNTLMFFKTILCGQLVHIMNFIK